MGVPFTAGEGLGVRELVAAGVIVWEALGVGVPVAVPTGSGPGVADGVGSEVTVGTGTGAGRGADGGVGVAEAGIGVASFAWSVPDDTGTETFTKQSVLKPIKAS